MDLNGLMAKALFTSVLLLLSAELSLVEKLCGSAGDIENGRYELDGNVFGAKAYAKCKEGFVLKGENVRECLDNGWSGTIPTCEVSDSSPPVSDSSPPVSNSSPPVSDSSPPVSDSSPPVSGSSSRVSRSSSFRRRTGVIDLTCPHPAKHIATFNEIKSAYNPGESLSVCCVLGFKPYGTYNIKCGPKGNWIPRPPRCSVVKCPILKIAHGKVNEKRLKFNTTVKITCEDGFLLKGANNVTCAANGSWAPAVPTCGLETTGKCAGLPHYPDANPREDYLGLSQFESGASVRFKCDYGYRQTGGSSRILCENGSWTPLEMTCEKRQCGSAGEIQNGRFQYTGVSFGDTARAECNEGYHLFGVGVRLCRGEGWEGRVPVCEAVQCPMPPEVPGAEISEHIEEPITYRQTVSYHCLSGSLIGPEYIYCMEDGTWSGPLPECREVSCPVPSVQFGLRTHGFRSHYSPRHTVRFTCNPGYKIQGSEWITCGTNGNWTPDIPKCVPRYERVS